MSDRRTARHQALHILYQREITEEPIGSILEGRTFLEEEMGDPDDFAKGIVTGVEVRQDVLDDTIESISENWTLSRMPLVDRSILRIAVWEILFADDIPDSVSINEAVEMAKVYGGEDSSKFVNGILGKLAEQHGTATQGSTQS
jgi:N utilization substance protein B